MYTNIQALEDKNFLKTLCAQQLSTRFIKIVALDINNYPVEEIQGQVTQGSISIDGKSIVRRTCSLSLITQQTDFNQHINWSLHTKIQLFVGLQNLINPLYPNIIWFKMGTYILTSFNAAIQNDGSYSISLQGKDKMCLLNGDIGGNLTALSYDFGHIIIENEDGTETEEAVPLKQIIQEAVHTYANEPYHNIIVNDLDDYGLELLEYRGEEPLIYEININDNTFHQAILNSKALYYCYRKSDNPLIADSLIGNRRYTIEEINNHIIVTQNNQTTQLRFNTFETLSPASVEGESFYFTKSLLNNNTPKYYLLQIQPGMTCGYRETELVYAGELTGAVGEPVTKILTNIQNMLSDFEYFYDIDGRFVFQKKKTSNYVVWNHITNQDNQIYVDVGTNEDKYVYKFNDCYHLTSFSNNADINNIKNDFSVWGTKEGIGGGDIPIHMRYAIHTKPQHYIAWERYQKVISPTVDQLNSYYIFNNNTYQRTTDTEINNNTTYYIKTQDKIHYTTNPNILSTLEKKVVDWREIIYQMALDWQQHNNENDFYSVLGHNNYEWYPSGVTGYEQYYTDMLEFWRQLYNPEQVNTYSSLEITEFDYIHSAKNYEGLWFYEENNQIKPITLTVKTEQSFNPTLTYLYTRLGEKRAVNGLTPEEKRQLYYKQQQIEEQKCVIRAPFQTNIQYYTKTYKYKKVFINDGVDQITVPDNTNYIEFIIDNSGDYYYNNTTQYFELYNNKMDNNITRYKLNPTSYYIANQNITANIHSRYFAIIETIFEKVSLDSFSKTVYNNASFNTYYIPALKNGTIIFTLPTTQYLNYRGNDQTYFYKENGTTYATHFQSEEEYKYNIEALGRSLYITTTTYKLIPMAMPYPSEYVVDRQYLKKIDAKYISDDASKYKGWTTNIVENPEGLTFWIDFLDPTDTELEKYSVSNIGSRAKSIKEDRITSIYFNETLPVIFKGTTDNASIERSPKRQGYSTIQVPNKYKNLFSVSSQGQSACDTINSFLNEYTQLSENVSLTTDPLYFLQPNERIYIQDTIHNVEGEYEIDKITIPLQANSQITITANKIIPLNFG